MVKQARDALADRQAQPQTLLAPVERLLVTVELIEDLPHVVLGNAGTGIPYLQLHFVATMAHRQYDAPLAGVAQRVGQEILQHAAQQAAITAYPRRAREQVQAQATTGGDRRVLRRQFAHQRTHVEFADHRVQATRIQP